MAFGTTKYKVRCTFTWVLLGSAPLNQEIYNEFVAGKAMDLLAKGKMDNHAKAPTVAEIQEEADDILESGEKGKTGFLTDTDGNPYITAYVIPGFFKETCQLLKRNDAQSSKETLSAKLTAYKKVIDGGAFVRPRKVRIQNWQAHGVGEFQRPLRAATAQGERIALANSQTIFSSDEIAVDERPYIEFELIIVGTAITPELLTEWFDYGALHGLGQFRNGGFGTFEYTMERL